MTRDRRVTTGPGWRFWIDRGGTFTDVIGAGPDGGLVSRKLLSGQHGSDGDAALAGIRDILGVAKGDALPAAIVTELRMGTTVATNALLERTGAPAALLITCGFADALRIAYQNRPDLFALDIRLPDPLHARVVECAERLGPNGEIIERLNEAALERDLATLLEEGISSLAIVFMHAYRHPRHEQAAAALARRMGFSQVSVSHELNPVIKLIARGDTTLVDAYLNPLLHCYVEEVRKQLAELGGVQRLRFMQSSGGLTDADRFRGKDSVLSGPAGGIVGMSESARLEGFRQVIGFDMGGTSTDVSVYNGEFERSEETEVAGTRIRAAMLKIHTIAAGGGSILHYTDGRLQIGPQSAGARPGPAAYGLGGPLTVTDSNVLLGRLRPEFFPALLGEDGRSPLQPDVVREKFTALAAQVSSSGFHIEPEALAEQYLQIAVMHMANAIKHISVQRGHDLSRYVLACFGGAGPQHACDVADALGITRVLIHPLAGLLSAWGIGLAPVTSFREQTLRTPLNERGFDLTEQTRLRLQQEVLAELAAQGHCESGLITLDCQVRLRYAGTDTSLPVTMDQPAQMTAQFTKYHSQRFGFAFPDQELVVESVWIEAAARDSEAGRSSVNAARTPSGSIEPLAVRPVRFAGSWQETPFFDRGHLLPGAQQEGPAILLENGATTVVAPGWHAEVSPHNQILLRRRDPPKSASERDTEVDPARLEIFNNLFMHIAEQMGAVLRNTARSVNIKERLDFSCAVFDGQGQLVANAPHMPVHLGSMGESVKAVIADNPGMGPGDVYMLNDPYRGGTHLPDITVVTPVFARDRRKADFFVASRGHHADIGGISPGSMPPASRTIDEEGVLFTNFLLVREGRFAEEQLLAALTKAHHPARNPAQNIADLKAQVAANQQGLALLNECIAYYGREVCLAYMQHVQDNAEEAVRNVISRLTDGRFEYAMDNDLVIRVAVTVNQAARTACVDFTGTSAQHDGNFNAPYAVCCAAVLYVFRCLVNAPVPLNAGCLKPIEIRVPEGSLLNPRPPAAVVAGNVETSQCITDALFGALGVVAAAQGTMNNFTFGDARHQYYETIAGGSGAGPGFPGCDAVQTHMTNSRLTDPEVLELRFPVLVREFSIRANSGGQGRYRGGNGARRELEFRAPMQAAILSGHRSIPPFGLAGGAAGACGRNTLLKKEGSAHALGATATVTVETGDRIVIETPGGGGYGKPGSDA